MVWRAADRGEIPGGSLARQLGKFVHVNATVAGEYSRFWDIVITLMGDSTVP
jgi:hypothetical protein